ncbi:glycoside hydrolase family 10 protein [Christiangramia crocea]|uniref:Family 10 glycosylhydrolase n=1 Tax=Christiangramia crocea TaxID=2904124 RepID=A0A9X2A5H7_9FLAO|nr:family 10 glycosylhydrolase [Gramella crocea]MCG9971444.1 family 10 glycosylhydrolase [Gramella crocea]
MLRHSVRFLVYLTAVFLASCKTTNPVSKPEPPLAEKTTPQDTILSEKPPVVVKEPQKPEEKQPEIKVTKMAPPLDIYEFRAAWVATVANINWPSKSGLSTSEQQREALKLLDFLKENNFNAVIFQVRPQTDAFYDSQLEPWSYFLTGKQGKAPEPYYDPLKFWIEAAHNRGLELHVWLNPYRAHHTTGGEVSDASIIKKKPDLAVKLENGMWWLDPSKQGTQDHSAAVVMDIVKRYDIDGVHFDDYFYPYDSYNNGKDFPDDISWNTYKSQGGDLLRGDWRRQHVNKFIKRVYDEIKTEKPYVKFGLSPFGIWRPGYPQSVTGYDQYEKLYADAKLWLNEGWIDYFTPQLYWRINQEGQSFPELLGWWERENRENRHLWPGINVGLGGDDKNIDETINQIMITRGMLPESKGTVHWSIGPLVAHDSLAIALKEGPYKKRTLVPASPWLDKDSPETPQVQTSVNNDRLHINWNHPEDDNIFRWVVYFKYEGGNWDYKILDQGTKSYSLQYIVGNKKKKMEQIGVTAVDRTGKQSEFKALKVN